MPEIDLGTGQEPTTLPDLEKGASGRSAIAAVVEGLGLQPGRLPPPPVETVAAEPASEPEPLDATQQPAVEPTSTFDLKAHEDELVLVQIDGQSVAKPLKEVLNGYMRQADFTRKTQEVAEQRRRLEEGITPEMKQLMELGRAVATNEEARRVVAEVLEPGRELDPETQQAQRIQQLESRLDTQARVAEAERQIAALVEAHPESQEHLQDVIAEMRRTGSKDPISTWRAMDYSNVPERLAEKTATERAAKAAAAEDASVVNVPTGATSGTVSAEAIPVKDDNGFALSGRDFVRSLLERGAAA